MLKTCLTSYSINTAHPLPQGLPGVIPTIPMGVTMGAKMEGQPPYAMNKTGSPNLHPNKQPLIPKEAEGIIIEIDGRHFPDGNGVAMGVFHLDPQLD
jgi:hypothetical protein